MKLDIFIVLTMPPSIAFYAIITYHTETVASTLAGIAFVSLGIGSFIVSAHSIWRKCNVPDSRHSPDSDIRSNRLNHSD